MSEPFIERVRIRGYGCVKDASLELTRLHALIGPNDSGKTTILRAIRTACQFATDAFYPLPGEAWSPFDPEIDARADLNLEVALSEPKLTYQFSVQNFRMREQVFDAVHRLAAERSFNTQGLMGTRAIQARDLVEFTKEDVGGTYKKGELALLDVPTIKRLGDSVVAASWSALSAAKKIFELNARSMRLLAPVLQLPTERIISGRPVQFFDENGGGLAAVLDAIRERNLEAFAALHAQALEHFSHLAKVGPASVTPEHAGVEAVLKDGTRVPAKLMSEGVLYYLAFAAARYLAPTLVLLVEEPENGLHPSRIADVVGLLRETSKTTQVILATHSPLVINELEANEVTVVTRSEENGTRCRRLDQTYNFRERSGIYANGELWLSYCGDGEEALLYGPDP